MLNRLPHNDWITENVCFVMDRMEPFGVRCRICDAELENIADAEEFVIRDDGGRIDTGYPWIASLGNNRYFVIYYNNNICHKGAGGIEGTLLEVTEEN